jgi:hypothetical protein
MEKKRKRLERAEAQIREAGGSVQTWWDGLSAKRREEWDDLLPELLRHERLHEESETAWSAFTRGQPDFAAPKPLPAVAREPVAEWPDADSGIIL